MAFNRSTRLTKEYLLNLVRRKGVRFDTPFFRMSVLPSRRTTSQVAVIVSSKIAKKAVDRNRIRRRLQESLRTLLPQHPDMPPHLITIWGKSRAYDAEFSQIQTSFDRILIQICQKV